MILPPFRRLVADGTSARCAHDWMLTRLPSPSLCPCRGLCMQRVALLSRILRARRYKRVARTGMPHAHAVHQCMPMPAPKLVLARRTPPLQLARAQYQRKGRACRAPRGTEQMMAARLMERSRTRDARGRAWRGVFLGQERIGRRTRSAGRARPDPSPPSQAMLPRCQHESDERVCA